MNIQSIYYGVLSTLEKAPQKVDKTKTFVAETAAIIRKAPLYKKTIWTSAQQKEFDSFWVENYGKRIPNYWHKLYQTVSGVFQVDYIPEMLYTTRIEPTMNDWTYAKVFEDKSMIELFARQSGCVVPKTICVCANGYFYNDVRSPMMMTDAAKRVNGERNIVLKPTVGGSSGKGIRFINDCTQLTLSEIEKLFSLMGSNFIVQEGIKASPRFSALNSSSINTIRITTFLTENAFHHIPIALRIGRSSKQVDNIHAGGIGVGVSDDGVLLPKAYELSYGDCTRCYERHPDSGIAFTGYTLPKIPEIIQAAYLVHGRMPHIGIVSWDFTVDKDDNIVLLEANITGQGIWFPQMIHGRGPFGDQTRQILNMIKKSGK